MQKDDLVYAGHMLDTARKAASKVIGKTREDYDDDENLRMALAHLIQTLGEAPRASRRPSSNPARKSRGNRSSGCDTGWFMITCTWITTSSGLSLRPTCRRSLPNWKSSYLRQPLEA